MEKEIFIKRGRLTSDFTTFPNKTLRDVELSLQARGLLTYMLSHSNSFEFNLVHLSKISRKNKRDSVASALNELIDFSYVHRIAVREKGKFKGYKYFVSDIPDTEFKSDCQSNSPNTENPFPVNPNTENPFPVNPNTENPETDKPNTGNPQQRNTNLKKNQLKEKSKEELAGLQPAIQSLLVDKWKLICAELAGVEPKSKQAHKEYVACADFATEMKKKDFTSDESILEKWENFLRDTWALEKDFYRSAFRPSSLWQFYDSIVIELRQAKEKKGKNNGQVIQQNELSGGSVIQRL